LALVNPTLLAACLVTFNHFDDAIAAKEAGRGGSADLGEAWQPAKGLGSRKRAQWRHS
jgi:hypothetical protein